MNTVIRCSALLSLLGLAACEPVLFSAELDVPEVCVKGINVTFPPTSVAAFADDPLSYTDLADSLPADLDLDIEVLELGLKPADGVPNLDFVDRLGVRMTPLDPSAPLTPISLLELGSDDHEADGTMRRIATQPIDVTTFLKTSDALFAFDVAGELPAGAWSGTMDVCLHTRATYKKPL